jgi:hypothetical protein
VGAAVGAAVTVTVAGLTPRAAEVTLVIPALCSAVTNEADTSADVIVVASEVAAALVLDATDSDTDVDCSSRRPVLPDVTAQHDVSVPVTAAQALMTDVSSAVVMLLTPVRSTDVCTA